MYVVGTCGFRPTVESRPTTTPTNQPNQHKGVAALHLLPLLRRVRPQLPPLRALHVDLHGSPREA